MNERWAPSSVPSTDVCGCARARPGCVVPVVAGLGSAWTLGAPPCSENGPSEKPEQRACTSLLRLPWLSWLPWEWKAWVAAVPPPPRGGRKLCSPKRRFRSRGDHCLSAHTPLCELFAAVDQPEPTAACLSRAFQTAGGPRCVWAALAGRACVYCGGASEALQRACGEARDRCA